MTEVLKLNVTYGARYGSDVDETLILPAEVNGVLFEKLNPGETLNSAVWLGELEGKHSECYGDLEVDIVDLDELNPMEVTNLIRISSYNRFESFFEELEIDFAESEDKDEDAANELMRKYGFGEEHYGLDTSGVHDKFIEQMKIKYSDSFKAINIREEDYQRALDLLSEYGIKVFNK